MINFFVLHEFIYAIFVIRFLFSSTLYPKFLYLVIFSICFYYFTDDRNSGYNYFSVCITAVPLNDVVVELDFFLMKISTVGNENTSVLVL